MTKKMYRQGDVLITACDPPHGSADPQKDLVLAEGEATGHAHRVVGKAILMMIAARMYLHTQEQSQVTHEEHGHIDLDPGWYEIRRQREFHAGMIRPVLD